MSTGGLVIISVPTVSIEKDRATNTDTPKYHIQAVLSTTGAATTALRTANCNIYANLFWKFLLKWRDNGDDDFLLKNGRISCNSRYVRGIRGHAISASGAEAWRGTAGAAAPPAVPRYDGASRRYMPQPFMDLCREN